MLDALDLLLKAVPPFAKKKAQRPPEDGAEIPDNDQDVPDEDGDGVPDDQDADSGAPANSDTAPDGAPGDEEPAGDEGVPGPGDGDGDELDDGDMGPEGDDGMDAPDEGDMGPEDAPEDGDLGDDPQSLIQQIADAERDYYAAKGFHGPQHHNAMALLDTYHKLVRKLVRAVQGGQGGQGAQGPGDEEQVDEQDVEMEPDDQDADGDGTPDDQDVDADGDGQKDTGAEDDQASAKPPAFGKKQPAEPPAFGKEQPPKKPKGKPFGKSERALGKSLFHALQRDVLRKGLDGFADDGTDVAIPDRFLMPYLVSFIETSYGVVSQESPQHMYNEQEMAQRIMCQLVQSLSTSKNLRTAASRYKITQAAVAQILRDRQIISVTESLAAKSTLPTDEDSHAATGSAGISGAVFQLSQGNEWFKALDADQHAHSSSSKLSYAPSPHKQTRFVDDRRVPHFGRAANVALDYSERDRVAKASIAGNCVIHGYHAVQQTDMLTHAFGACSCPHE